MKDELRHQKKLDSFIAYCKQHPSERFWQALRNWANVAFIFTADGSKMGDDTYKNLKDTFYIE